MSELQVRASDPDISIWVSASAGTGKTKILTDRIVRLLLSGTELHKILCLTFTNAAADEMYERINCILLSWAKFSDIELEHSLTDILGKKPTKFEHNFARNLHKNILHLEKRINIYTIHSFCQKILKMFPSEAGVNHNFEVIDELRVNKVIKDIKRKIFTNKDLKTITDFFVQNFHEVTINELFLDVIENKEKFHHVLKCNKLHNLKTHHHINDKSISAAPNNKHLLKHIALYPLIQHYIGVNANSDDIKSFFLTKTGQKKKKIISSKSVSEGSNTYDQLLQIQEEIYQLDQKSKLEELLYSSKMMENFASAIISEYNNYKKNNNLLDYNDLIEKTQILLTTSESKDWVLYKLDGGIDHLLVDEAQDTSLMQWQIIETLISEFHSGDGTSDLHRTVFVVGDEKQSIFSFQGADINSFQKMNKLLQNKLLSGQKPFDKINLEVSYRSTKAVLNIVYNVFNNIMKNTPHFFSIPIIDIRPFRDNHPGKVELWDLCTHPQNDKPFWPIIDNEEMLDSSQVQLAKKIAHFIADELKSQKILPSTGKVISPEDFMILFRTRDDFTLEVIKQIKEHKINVSGLDRICLNKNLAVQDLISIAKFVINPLDNLNLASLLKSPFIDVSEEQLQKIVLSSGKQSIWEWINSINHLDSFLTHIIQTLQFFISLYHTSNIHNFFHRIIDLLGYRNTIMHYYLSDSHDAVNEFLYLAYDYSKNHDASISNFIRWFAKQNIDIKRDINSKDSISIMTVHGSKGLQAPVVILCDTTSVPTTIDKMLLDENDQLLFAKSSSNIPEFYQKLKEKYKDKMMQEYMRLLYVAMTRAEDNLIVCGYQGHKSLPEHCWYNSVRTGMINACAKKEENKMVHASGDAKTSSYKVPKSHSQTQIRQHDIAVNSCFNSRNNIIKTIPDYHSLRKNNTAGVKHSSKGASQKIKDPIEYGTIFHKIMEDAIRNNKIQEIHTHSLIKTLNSQSQKRILHSIGLLKQNTEFINMLKQEVKTEFAIGIEMNGHVKIGRMDLVVFDTPQKHITIIDYKTDYTIPKTLEMITPNYIDQLNFYKEAMQSIYQNAQISCKILWLTNGSFTCINQTSG